jgi:hypothetical protein
MSLSCESFSTSLQAQFRILSRRALLPGLRRTSCLGLCGSAAAHRMDRLVPPAHHRHIDLGSSVVAGNGQRRDRHSCRSGCPRTGRSPLGDVPGLAGRFDGALAGITILNKYGVAFWFTDWPPASSSHRFVNACAAAGSGSVAPSRQRLPCPTSCGSRDTSIRFCN